jgi:hypothetical protein
MENWVRPAFSRRLNAVDNALAPRQADVDKGKVHLHGDQNKAAGNSQDNRLSAGHCVISLKGQHLNSHYQPADPPDLRELPYTSRSATVLIATLASHVMAFLHRWMCSQKS